MFKKRLAVIVPLLGMLILAACSSLNLPGLTQSASAQSNQTGAQNAFSDPSKMPLEQKLAVGILKLEGTNQAVTAKEANDMLPLWQAYKALSTDTNTTPEEVTALEKQIEDTLTPEQVKAIQDLTLTSADIQALAKQEGIQFSFGNGNGTNPLSTLNPSDRATRVAQFQSQNRTGANGGGFVPGAGGFAPGGGGGFGGGGRFGGATNGQQPNVQRTPRPGTSARRAGGMNYLFVDPLIKLLQQRAAG